MFPWLPARRWMYNQSVLTEVKQLEGLVETHQPPRGKILVFSCSFLLLWSGIAESKRQWDNLTGRPPAPSAVIGSSISHQVMQTLFSSLSPLAVSRGRILQACHQPVKLAYCPNLKLLQHCKSQCYGLPLEGCSQSTVFSNRGTWMCWDLAAAQLADKSASRNKRIGSRKRLNPNQIVALSSLQIRFETTIQSVLLCPNWIQSLHRCKNCSSRKPSQSKHKDWISDSVMCLATLEHFRLFGDNW